MSLDSLKALIKDLGLSWNSPRECSGPGEGETLVRLKIELATFRLQIRLLFFFLSYELFYTVLFAVRMLSTRVAEGVQSWVSAERWRCRVAVQYLKISAAKL